MRLTLLAMLLAIVLGCAQSGETRDGTAAQPQPAKKYRDGPVTPKAMQPVPSSY